MAIAEPPVRHRAETVQEQNLRMELTVLRGDVRDYCDFLQPRLERLEVASYEIGPEAHQLVIGSQRLVASLRQRVDR